MTQPLRRSSRRLPSSGAPTISCSVTAILDRLLHHAVTLDIRGNSYRLKEKLKAGLVRSEEAEA
jgi:hypothetical protein